MGFDVAALIISGLSAVANIIQAYKSAKDLHGNLTPDEADKISEDAEAEAMSMYFLKDEMKPIYDCIDHELLQVILQNINQAEERLKAALKDSANSNQEKDKEVRIASSTICAELSRIRRLNRGRFPHIELERLWNSFGCNENGG